MIRSSIKAIGIVSLVCALPTNSVTAGSLLGTPATFELAYPTVSDVEMSWGPFTVVDTGPEVTSEGIPGQTSFVLTVTGNTLTVFFPDGGQAYGGAFNGYIFVDNQVTITGVSIDPSTTLTAFDASRLSFDSHDIYGNGTGIAPPVGSSVTLDISSISEPSAIVLMTISGTVVSLFTLGRRRRRDKLCDAGGPRRVVASPR